ncbi:hypothetical protein EDB83DRAFT_2424090 [Lactarius deliciosus]|nr:hypothetical protein EDB83DRAFT_2424090 [Lactarius deliciosus]
MLPDFHKYCYTGVGAIRHTHSNILLPLRPQGNLALKLITKCVLLLCSLQSSSSVLLSQKIIQHVVYHCKMTHYISCSSMLPCSSLSISGELNCTISFAGVVTIHDYIFLADPTDSRTYGLVEFITHYSALSGAVGCWGCILPGRACGRCHVHTVLLAFVAYQSGLGDMVPVYIRVYKMGVLCGLHRQFLSLF